MSEIYLFLKRAFRLVAMLPFIWFAFVIIWGTLVPDRFCKNLIYAERTGYTNLRLKEASETRDVEVLIIGSSHVYRGIDPRTFETLGLKTFNLGTSLQTPLQSEYLLKKYLDQMNPEVVLFEIGYKTFSSDGIEGAIDVIINSTAFDRSIFSMALKVNDISVYNTLAYTIFRKGILGETRQQYLAAHVEEYVPGGFVEREDMSYVGPDTFESTTLRLEADQQRAFERCLDYLSSRGIKTILIQTPILQHYYTSIQNMDEFNSYFISLSREFHVYDFNDKVYRHTKYFYDHHHLNSLGVEKFNQDLVEAIWPHLDGL